MSGHSKWATIKRKKAKEDNKRGKIFTRIVREIMVAARSGGDPAGNAKLRLLIEKAKQANMPQDNITRAIKKGTGELAGEAYESVMYEGYGPGGIAILVDALTDNRNRTASDLRHAFTKNGGNMAETGAVGWLFDQKGVITLAQKGLSEDDILEKLIEYNIEDIKNVEGNISLVCAMSELESIKAGVEKAGFAVEAAEVEWIPKNYVAIEDKVAEEKAYKMLEALEELDDVQNVHTNLG